MKYKIYIKKSDAIAYYGGVTKLAEAIGVLQSAVSQWGEEVPQSSAWPLYFATERRIKCTIKVE